MQSFKLFLIEEVSAEDVPLTLDYHKRLNPDLWTGNTLRAKVKQALLKIANEFENFLETPAVDVIDVILTGSMANFNWTSHSDVDLHLIVGNKEAEKKKDGIDITELFWAKKALWANQHNITIFGHPVEVYVQLADQKLYSTGIYSLTMNEWVDKPQKNTNGHQFDPYAVKIKAAGWINEIDAAIENKVDPDTIKRLKDKIHTMRKSGLETGGEFSIENICFKTLRNLGYIDRLFDYSIKKLDSELSLEK